MLTVTPIRRYQGFTLIEVLVAVVVLSIGLLGLAGLQTRSLRASQSAWMRSEASILAYDMLDRMRSNRDAGGNWLTAYSLALADDAPTGSDRAQLDLNAWIGEIARRLPAGDGQVTIVNNLVTVTVQWDDTRGAAAAQQFVVQSR